MTEKQSDSSPSTVAYGRTDGRARVEQFTCVVNTAARDVIVLVPGTVDPVNATPGKNGADIGYWEENKNFKATVAAYKLAYCDTHILITFAWSGDNSKDKRKEAGIKLKEFLMNHYGAKTAKRETRFHLIGHSHGGNVINEFTQAIANDPNFPNKWKVKSITYLSTPFFKHLHQLNIDTNKLHPQCQIINVCNEFDLTQRVVADFSMKQLGLLTEAIKENDDFKEAKLTLMGINKSVYNPLNPLTQFSGAFSVEQGRAMWGTTLDALTAVDSMLRAMNAIFIGLNNDHKYFITDRILIQVQDLIAPLRRLLENPTRNFTQRIERDRVLNAGRSKSQSIYSRGAFLIDIDVGDSIINILRLLNRYLQLDAQLIGPLTQLLDDILMNQLDQYDDTTHTPEHQVKGKFPIRHVKVTRHDRYYGSNAARRFTSFIHDLEALETEYETNQTPAVRMRIVFTCLAQMNYSFIAEFEWWANLSTYILTGEADTEAKIFVSRLKALRQQLDLRNRHIVVEADKDNSFLTRRGSIAYLAVVSHSVSRQEFYPEVKAKLDSVIESIPMPGKQKSPANKFTLKRAVEK